MSERVRGPHVAMSGTPGSAAQARAHFRGQLPPVMPRAPAVSICAVQQSVAYVPENNLIGTSGGEAGSASVIDGRVRL